MFDSVLPSIDHCLANSDSTLSMLKLRNTSTLEGSVRTAQSMKACPYPLVKTMGWITLQGWWWIARGGGKV